MSECSSLVLPASTGYFLHTLNAMKDVAKLASYVDAGKSSTGHSPTTYVSNVVGLQGCNGLLSSAGMFGTLGSPS